MRRRRVWRHVRRRMPDGIGREIRTAFRRRLPAEPLPLWRELRREFWRCV